MGLVGDFILLLPGNIEDSINGPTRKLTEGIAALFSLISTSAHTGFHQYGIHNYRDVDGDDAAMADVNEFK